MGINTGTAVFWIGKVEYGAPSRRVFFKKGPNGVNLQVGEGRGEKKASCVVQANFFQHVFVNN